MIWMLTEQQAKETEDWPNSSSYYSRRVFSASDSDWHVGSMSARSKPHPRIRLLTRTLVSFAKRMSLWIWDPHTSLLQQLKRLYVPNTKANPEQSQSMLSAELLLCMSNWSIKIPSLVWKYSVIPFLHAIAGKLLIAMLLEQMMLGPRKVKKALINNSFQSFFSTLSCSSFGFQTT